MLSSLAMALMERPRFPPCLLLPLVYSCLFLCFCFCLLFLFVYSCPSSDLTDFQAIFALSILPSLHTFALYFLQLLSYVLFAFIPLHSYFSCCLPLMSSLYSCPRYFFYPLPQNLLFLSLAPEFFFSLSLSPSLEAPPSSAFVSGCLVHHCLLLTSTGLLASPMKTPLRLLAQRPLQHFTARFTWMFNFLFHLSYLTT